MQGIFQWNKTKR